MDRASSPPTGQNDISESEGARAQGTSGPATPAVTSAGKLARPSNSDTGRAPAKARDAASAEAGFSDDALRVAVARPESSSSPRASSAPLGKRKRKGEVSDPSVAQEERDAASASESLPNPLPLPALGPEAELQVFAVQDGSGSPIAIGDGSSGYLVAQAGAGPGPAASSLGFAIGNFMRLCLVPQDRGVNLWSRVRAPVGSLTFWIMCWIPRPSC